MAENGSINGFANNTQNAALETLVKMLSQFLLGANAFGVPGTAFAPGMSQRHSINSYQEQQNAKRFQTPLENVISNTIGNNVYASTLRLLGYSSQDIQKRIQSGGIPQSILSFGSSIYFQDAIKTFSNAAYRRATRDRMRNEQGYVNSYRDAAEGIVTGLSSGEIQGYSISDALKVSALFTRQGRYDSIQPRQRAIAIKNDLRDYAEGINNLKDGLQGSLEEVLDSFEKLTGSAATVMHKDRFTALSRGLYSATTYSGVTPQLLQSAIGTQHAYLQGTGATQATSTALGTLNAQILANGVSVEGASTNMMNEALTRQGARWMTSGKAKELTAAFGWWADTQGKSRNAETFQQFVASQLRGNIDASSVRQYLERNNVSGEYINSARNRRNMASPYIYTQYMQDNVKSYETNFQRLRRRYNLSDDDMYLTDDELSDKLMKSARSRNNGTLSSSEIARINRIVEERRNIIQGVTQTTDADNGLNLLRNERQVLTQQARSRAAVNILQGIGNNTNLKGLEGVLQELNKKQGVSKDTIAGVLGSWFGVNINQQDLGNFSAQDLERALRKSGAIDQNDNVNDALKWAIQDVNKMPAPVRDILFNTDKDTQVDKNNKNKTWKNYRQDLIKALRSKDSTRATQAIEDAKKAGFLDNEQAFLLRYSQSNSVDFRNNPDAMQHVKALYKTYTAAKEQYGITGHADQLKFAEQVQRIRAGAAKDGDESAVKAIITSQYKQEQDKIKHMAEGTEKDKAQKALQDKIQLEFDKTTSKSVDTDFWLEKIFNAVKEVAFNVGSN